MELHIKLPDDLSDFSPQKDISSSQWFKNAIRFANKFYPHEINRASSVRLDDLTPELFFREYIWVVHATGFSAKAVSKFIHKLESAYGRYEELGAKPEFDNISDVLRICNNKMKAMAVYDTARLMHGQISKIGFPSWKAKNIIDPDSLEKFPFIGKATKFHLGRNIGMLDCVKPDLHLIRLASHWKFSTAEQMISEMAKPYDLRLGIADMIAWYYASTFGTLFAKAPGER